MTAGHGLGPREHLRSLRDTLAAAPMHHYLADPTLTAGQIITDRAPLSSLLTGTRVSH